MALARGESNSSASVAEGQTDPVDPCLPSPGRERRAQKGRDRRGAYFVSFSPAVSRAAAKRIRQEMRRSWRLPRRTDKALTDLAHIFNSVAGLGTSATTTSPRSIRSSDTSTSTPGLVGHAEVQAVQGARRAEHWLGRIARRQPTLFAHW
jgi:RNA-directed DNA polymerase